MGMSDLLHRYVGEQSLWAIIQDLFGAVGESIDPDGELVPLPKKEPHRYTVLGYTPRRFGEHG